MGKGGNRTEDFEGFAVARGARMGLVGVGEGDVVWGGKGGGAYRACATTML